MSGKELLVIAKSPAEMAVAQQGLIAWADGMVETTTRQIAEATDTFDTAKKNKWRTSGLRSHIRQGQDRLLYYEKIAAALREGYVIVPDMPIDVFAIRTSQTEPAAESITSNWKGSHNGQNFPQKAEMLEIGEGEYVADTPLTQKRAELKQLADGKKEEIWRTTATELQPVEFPFKLVKPSILDDTKRAMALKIFDEIGCLPHRRRRGDPMVIGRVKWKRGYQERNIAFLITWWLQGSDLMV